MSAHYTIIQYLPDPIIDEKINIGIVVLGNNKSYFRFLQNWRRVACFAENKNIAFLHEFVQQIEKANSSQEASDILGERVRLDMATIEYMITNWCNAIQFTPWRWSALEPVHVLEMNSARFLIDKPKKHTKRTRNRADVLRETAEHRQSMRTEHLR